MAKRREAQHSRPFHQEQPMSKPEMILASELVEDFDLYPRKDVDSQHVASMAESMAAGNELPPIIACRKTKRIVDGFHRRRAWIRHGGDGVRIPVVFHDYRSEGELFLEAMALNSGHGRRLATFDQVRCATMAAKFKLKPAQIASALRLTTERVEVLLDTRTATGALSSEPKAAPGERLQIPIKRTISHMAGTRLTKGQQEANSKLSGMSPLFYVNQLLLLLDNNLLPENDECLEDGLKRLHELLESRMVPA